MKTALENIRSFAENSPKIQQLGDRDRILKYAFSLFAVAIATYVRVLLNPILEDRLPFGFYTLTVMLVAWICGVGPSIMAIVVSAISAAHFIIPPHNTLHIKDPADQFATLVFLVVGTVFVALFSRLAYQRNRAMQQAIENVDLNKKLCDLDKRKDEFLSLLAHELRSPLAPIGNAIALTRLQDKSSECNETMQVISRNFKHLVRLVDDLLDVSRYLRGSIVLQRETIDLSNCVMAAIEMNKNDIDDKRHELIVDLPTEQILVIADPVRCSQIFCNLLSNAIKYTPENGRIHVSLKQTAETIEISIQDNGLGIPANIQQRVFEPFFQANLKQTRYGSGLGLGLSIVKRLVEMHEGTICIESSVVNSGSRFSIHFPNSIIREKCSAATADSINEPTSVISASVNEVSRANPHAQDTESSSTPTPPITSRDKEQQDADLSAEKRALRVLIVDDDRDTGNTLSQILNLEGYETATATSGLLAIRICNSFMPDVLLLDIGLPEMNGFQVARHLRATSFGNKLKIVAISGWGAESDKRAGKEAGFDVHLVKPVSLPQLLPHLSTDRTQLDHQQPLFLG
jgi:two-component system CheB/CheR fusion protein